MARSTRETILTATAELMRRKGYGAVGMKDIVVAGGVPIGSLYHHFPGGKVQIAREALLASGSAYGLLIPTLMERHDDLGAAIESAFAEAAQDMATSGFANMCPVGSVAAEVADTVEDLRVTAEEVFRGWLDGGTAYFVMRGVAEATARELIVALVAALEGAFILARTLRDTEPLLAAGRVLASRYRGITLAAAADVDRTASTSPAD